MPMAAAIIGFSRAQLARATAVALVEPMAFPPKSCALDVRPFAAFSIPRCQAADLASQGRDKIMEKAEDQKRAGAEYISGIAEAIRRAAQEFDNKGSFAANYIRTAASGVDNVAETVRNGDFSELMTQTQNFARRRRSHDIRNRTGWRR